MSRYDQIMSKLKKKKEGGALAELGLSKSQAKKVVNLPYEIAVYVPSTQDVSGKVSKEEMKKRVDEVQKYLSGIFGGFSSSDVEGGYVTTKQELVKEDIVKVIAFSTKESFTENKHKLVAKISEWSKRWGQEAIGVEIEGDLLYIPVMAKGGEVEKRYATEIDFYQYAKNDEEVIEKAKKVVNDMRDKLDNQAQINEIREVPFASLKSRKLENVPKYAEGGTIAVKTPRKEYTIEVGDVSAEKATEIVKEKYPNFTEFEYKRIQYKKRGKKGEFLTRIEPQETLEARWKKKKERIRTLSDNIGKLRNNVSRDLKSDDEKVFLSALIVAIMDKTGERVGNNESADNGHYGVTGFRKKHISVKASKVVFDYVGKSGVSHEKMFVDENIAKGLKKAISNSPNYFVFATSKGQKIGANHINEYLDKFGITAKDIRGYSANKWILDKLKDIKPEDTDKKRKKQFNIVLKQVASQIGHGAATLRKHYMMPEVSESWIEKGEVFNIKKAGYVLKKGGSIKNENKMGNGGKYEYLEEDKEVQRQYEEEQLKEGVKVEQEHKDLYEKLKKRLSAKRIAMPITEQEFYETIAKAHLREDDAYYILLQKCVEKKQVDNLPFHKGGPYAKGGNVEGEKEEVDEDDDYELKKGGQPGVRTIIFTKKVNPNVEIVVQMQGGRITNIENEQRFHFPFHKGQMLQMNVWEWARVNGWLVNGKNLSHEEKIFGVRVSDVPQGHEWRMIYPNKFREEGGEMAKGGSTGMNVENCERCGKSTHGKTIMSMFNEDIICMECKAEERNHPDYKKATDAELEALKGGNRNFKGIGYEKKAEGGGVEEIRKDYQKGYEDLYLPDVIKLPENTSIVGLIEKYDEYAGKNHGMILNFIIGEGMNLIAKRKFTYAGHGVLKTRYVHIDWVDDFNKPNPKVYKTWYESSKGLKEITYPTINEWKRQHNKSSGGSMGVGEVSNHYKVEVIAQELDKDGGGKVRWVSVVDANSEEEAERKAEERFNEEWKLSDLSFYSAKVIKNPTEEDKVVREGKRVMAEGGTMAEKHIELDNLRRELDYYTIYEPFNQEAMDSITNKMNKIHDEFTHSRNEMAKGGGINESNPYSNKGKLTNKQVEEGIKKGTIRRYAQEDTDKYGLVDTDYEIIKELEEELAREKKAEGGLTNEDIITKYNLWGKNIPVRFRNDKKIYFTKNIHPNRTNIFVTESGGQVRYKKLSDISVIGGKVVKFANGGGVGKNNISRKDKITHKGDEGGMLDGPSHAEGGIKTFVRSNDDYVEVEGGESIINKHAMAMKEKVVCEGTPAGVASAVNQLAGNGVKFADDGKCKIVKE